MWCHCQFHMAYWGRDVSIFSNHGKTCVVTVNVSLWTSWQGFLVGVSMVTKIFNQIEQQLLEWRKDHNHTTCINIRRLVEKDLCN